MLMTSGGTKIRKPQAALKAMPMPMLNNVSIAALTTETATLA